MTGQLQPSAELLLSLVPAESTAEDTIFPDWHRHSGTAEHGDNIENNPKIWDSVTLPTRLTEFDSSETVATHVLDQDFNLTAAVMGLTHDRAEYNPEQFPALVHHPQSTDTATLLWQCGLLASISDSTTDSIQCLLETIDALDRLDMIRNASQAQISPATKDELDGIRTASVSDLTGHPSEKKTKSINS